MNILNIFRKKKKPEPIIIPLVRNGNPTGMRVECFKDDETYKKLVIIYGEPLPKQIETILLKPE